MHESPCCRAPVVIIVIDGGLYEVGSLLDHFFGDLLETTLVFVDNFKYISLLTVLV